MYGLYACAMVLCYILYATNALSWLDSVFNYFCAGLGVVAYLKLHVEAFVVFYELVYFNKSSNWLSFNKIIPHACAAWRADFVKPAFETTTP